MRGEQAIFNLEIKKKSGLSINPDIQHSKVFSSVYSFNIKNFFFIWFKNPFLYPHSVQERANVKWDTLGGLLDIAVYNI